jgi:hypothetical protein
MEVELRFNKNNDVLKRTYEIQHNKDNGSVYEAIIDMLVSHDEAPDLTNYNIVNNGKNIKPALTENPPPESFEIVGARNSTPIITFIRRPVRPIELARVINIERGRQQAWQPGDAHGGGGKKSDLYKKKRSKTRRRCKTRRSKKRRSKTKRRRKSKKR